MHWADKIADEIIKSGKFKPYWVDDMKTPSGFAHIGSMMGPIIHSCIYRALKDRGNDAKLTYVFNDFDVADEFPAIFKEFLNGHEGKVLKMIPSPGAGFDNFADFIANDLKKSIEYLGFEAEYISSWDLYHQGKFDEVIRMALDGSEKIQDIYEKVSGSKKRNAGWLPFQTICENCGKLGTTKVFAWDGQKVKYRCEPNLVTWAKGCGHEGEVSPFGGTGKLPWKVDWAAHWKVLDITVEGAGKDHASAGGSYDIALTILEEIFKKQKPYHFGYEFLLIGGHKMSSSKGVGLKAHDLVKILPASVARFLFVNNDIWSQGNFDPLGTTAIPDLFDAYDKAWEAYDKGGDDKLARTYVLSQTGNVPAKEKGFFAPRFRDVANFLSQGFTNEEILKKFTDLKGGKIDDTELSILEERIKYASVWLENYAPDEFRFDMTKEIPDEAKNLTDLQKKYLDGIPNIFGSEEDPGTLQISLFELAKEMGIPTKDAFAAIYLSFIGKTHGPRAGLMLTNFGREKVIKRINDVTSTKVAVKAKKEKFKFPLLSDENLFSISKRFSEKYPSATVGIAILRGIEVKDSVPELQTYKEEVLSELEGITVDQAEKSPEILSYRRLYKESGVDWAKKKASPAALLRRIAQGKGLYTINTCVDAYNLVVMKHRVSAGAFDLDQMTLPTVLDVAQGGEKALYIGDKEETVIEKGEVCYFDQTGPYNLDFNYRDSIRTSVTRKTKNIIINVEGVYDITRGQVETTLSEVINNIQKFCGGKLEQVGIYLASKK